MHQRLYLKVGDHVIHAKYPQWGHGKVIEVKTSLVLGGLCLVRILFGDGIERSFNNSLDDYSCCYYSGLRIYSGHTFPNNGNKGTKRIRRGPSN